MSRSGGVDCEMRTHRVGDLSWYTTCVNVYVSIRENYRLFEGIPRGPKSEVEEEDSQNGLE